MNQEITDQIEKEIVINASCEAVYSAIADPEQIVKWFPNAVEGDFEAGARPIFDFGDGGRNQVYIVEARPHDYFAYRWIPGSKHFIGDVLAHPNTLVEFFVEPVGEQTKVTLKETGFASLPLETMQQQYQDNMGGWTYMTERLATLFANA